ncbi:MAG: hypothetical protein WD969_05945 [Paracoccaceae bacterium]
MRPQNRILAAVLGLLLFQGAQVAEAAPNDLRDFRIGMTLSSLPEMGYGNFTCGGTGSADPVTLDAWAGFARCPADEDGLHEVAFDYVATRVEFVKANDKWEGTRVFGHPSIVSLLLDDEGVVRKIRIATDPRARRYMRKKAFLLGQRSKYHFSPTTWQCEDLAAAADEEPVGGVFYKERCVNRYDDRVVKLEIDLYHKRDQPEGSFVNATRIEIAGAD